MSLHVELSPEARKRLNIQKRNSTIASFLVSLLVIGIIVLTLGLFLLPSIIKESPTIVTYAAQSTTEDTPEQKKVQKIERKPSAPSVSMAKVIATAAPSATSIPVPDVDVQTESMDFGTAQDFGTNWGMGTDFGKNGGGGSLFGRQVNSANLGVILDVSGSAHIHLDKTIIEIEENFPTAHIIFVVGCGMSDGKHAFAGGGGKVPGKPRVVPYSDIDSEKEYNSLPRSVPAQLEGFFRKVDAKRNEELRKKFSKRDNLYALYGGDIQGTNFAFDFLLDINVDTIYWFADFADGINKEVIEDLTKDLRRSGVTVISHNFLGKPVGALATEMTKKTGGQTIELIPGEEVKKSD